MRKSIHGDLGRHSTGSAGDKSMQPPASSSTNPHVSSAGNQDVVRSGNEPWQQRNLSRQLGSQTQPPPNKSRG